MAGNYVLRLYERFGRLPLGRRLFSRFAARQAPYFQSVAPQVLTLSAGNCEVLIRKRRAVTNHIGTVHVIAIANGLEMAMGIMAEASIPPTLRWLPKGMTLDYVSKGATDIRCVASLPAQAWQPGEVKVPVSAFDTADAAVVTGTITLWVTEKPAEQKPAHQA